MGEKIIPQSDCNKTGEVSNNVQYSLLSMKCIGGKPIFSIKIGF